MKDTMTAHDHREAVALFRAQVLGPLLCRNPGSHGELAQALRELASEPVRPPGQETSRQYAVPTLQRWYYAYKRQGLEGLKPRRQKMGFANRLTTEQRDLLLATRRDHPSVSAELILRTFELEGRLPPKAITASTLRRLYAREGLDRVTLRQSDKHARRRWEAAAPNLLWHTDVCHGPALRVDGRAMPLRIHALLDDHSRYVVAIEARTDERETAMLALVVKALRLHGAPDAIYADNGSTYVGDTLATACARLGIGLIHAKPHDPQARGKMERFWRTLREQCLNYCGGLGSLHDVQARLVAWLQKHYHATAHSALMGKTPAAVYEAEPRKPVPDAMMREALIVRGRRRVRRDGTVSIAGTTFEVAQGYLAGKLVTIGRTLLDPSKRPWIEHEEQRFDLEPVEAQRNAIHPRPHRPKRGIDAAPFDPASTYLDAVTGNTGNKAGAR